MQSRFLVALVVAALAWVPVAHAAPPARSWSLRLLPTERAMSYTLTTTDTVSVEAGGRITTHVTHLNRAVTRTLALGPAGQLEVAQADQELAVQVGRGSLTLAGARPPARFSVAPDGRTTAGPPLDLILPPGPVALGARWTAPLPPSRQQPVALSASYRLEREDTVAGRRCLLIAAEITGDANGPAGSHLNYRGRARLAFDPRAGLLVRAISDARTVVTQPPDQRGPRRRTNRVQSKLELATP